MIKDFKHITLASLITIILSLLGLSIAWIQKISYIYSTRGNTILQYQKYTLFIFSGLLLITVILLLIRILKHKESLNKVKVFSILFLIMSLISFCFFFKNVQNTSTITTIISPEIVGKDVDNSKIFVKSKNSNVVISLQCTTVEVNLINASTSYSSIVYSYYGADSTNGYIKYLYVLGSTG